MASLANQHSLLFYDNIGQMIYKLEYYGQMINILKFGIFTLRNIINQPALMKVSLKLLQYITMIKMIQQADSPAFKTFIGAALIKFATGVVAIWGTVNIYFFSYLHNHGAAITHQTNSIIMLCSTIPSSFALLTSSHLSKRFGYKRVVRVCSFIFTIAPFIINFNMSLITLGLCYIIIPVSCCAISSMTVLNCLWSQFPNDLNKISGLTLLFFSLGMICWNIIFLNLTNPNNQLAQIDVSEQAFFAENISQNIFKATNIIFTISGGCFIVGSFLIQKKIDNNQLNLNALVQQSPLPLKKDQKDCIQLSKHQINSTSQTPSSSKQQIKLKQSLKDIKFIILWIICLIQPMYLIYMNSYIKLIFMPIINDDHYLAYCSIIVRVSAIFGAPFWGAIGDKKGFKTTLLIIVLCNFISKIIGLFCQEKWNLIVLYFMLGFADQGLVTIIGPGLIEIFGLETAIGLIPYQGISGFVALLSIPLVQILLSSFFSYKAILALLLVLSIVSLALVNYFYFKIQYKIPINHLAKQNQKNLQPNKNIISTQ